MHAIQGKFSSVQFSSVAQSCPTLCNHMDCSKPGFPVHNQLLELTKLMSVESVMPSNDLILCHPLLVLPSIFPSIRVFSSESVLPIRWPKYWSFSFSIRPSSEYSGLISSRMDWLDLLQSRDTQESSPTPQFKSIRCWRRLLRVPWTARRSNQSILKEISPWCSLEGMMLKLKLQYFGHLMGRTDSFEKTLMLGKIEGGRRRDDRG